MFRLRERVGRKTAHDLMLMKEAGRFDVWAHQVKWWPSSFKAKSSVVQNSLFSFFIFWHLSTGFGS